MAFTNQVITDDDLDRYGLPFPKGSSPRWTRDVDRDYYLWGGLWGHADGECWQEGCFSLYVDGVEYSICIEPGYQGRDGRMGTYVMGWNRLLSMEPEPPFEEADRIQSILREALVAYGFNGTDSAASQVKVLVDF